MKKILRWILVSSADPKKTSASVKFALLALIPYAIHAIRLSCGFGFGCLDISSESLTLVVENVASIVEGLLMIVALVGGIYSLVRKVVLTFKGENKALEEE